MSEKSKAVKVEYKWNIRNTRADNDIIIARAKAQKDGKLIKKKYYLPADLNQLKVYGKYMEDDNFIDDWYEEYSLKDIDNVRKWIEANHEADFEAEFEEMF